MRDLALPASILVLAGVLALDHLPTAHAEGPTDVQCTLIDRKGVPDKNVELLQQGLQPHAARGEMLVLPVPTEAAFVACSWKEVD